MAPIDAAREATRDIGLAVLATTLSLVVIFVPVSFMSSISGRFLYQFGITAAVAILVSLLVSFTLTPMMSSRLLRKEMLRHGETADSRGGFYARIDGTYTHLLTRAMAHRRAVSVIALLVVLSSLPLYHAVKQEFIPTNVDEAEFDVNLTANLASALSQLMKRGSSDTLDYRLIGNVALSSGFLRRIPFDERGSVKLK